VIVLPELRPLDSDAAESAKILAPPSAAHWFGTDRLGRDLFSRCIYAARRSVLLAVLAESLVLFLGISIGAAIGFVPHSWWRFFAEGIGAVALSLPFLLLAMVTSAVFAIRGLPLILAVTAVGWVYTMRLVRAEVLAIRTSPSVVAGLAWGFSSQQVVARLIVPRLLYLVPALALFGIADIIAIEAGLSFFGIGTIGGTPTLGGLLLEARLLVPDFWWLVAGPAVVLLALLMACNFLAYHSVQDGEARP
jgi:peptide/nickel transport system permease protein